jgi:asparagine synthase (glutamine-hydrolysing)
MFRYIGLLWNGANPTSRGYARSLLARLRAQSSAWRTALHMPDGVILTAGELPGDPPRYIHAADRSGVILGNCFRTSQPHRPFPELSPEECDRIVRSSGRSLIDEFWGNYVAFLWTRAGNSRLVVRSPCATLPCLQTEVGGVHLYFSSMESCADLQSQPFTVNWQHLARTLIGPLQSERTGINEVREVRAGFCDELTGGERIRHCYWNPVRIANTNRIERFEAAVVELRNAARASVHAWSTRAARILHALSGGLDSSIVLSCLSTEAAHPDVTCLTHFAEGADGDERPFARLVAKHFQYPLRENLRTSNIDVRGALYGVRLESNPGMRVRDIERIELDIARGLGVTAITKGSGGDELFVRHHAYFAAADLLRSRGIGFDLMDLLAHAAITEGETFWSTLARAVRGAFFPYRWNPAFVFRREQEGQGLLSPEAFDGALQSDKFDLPYVASTRDCAPGKLWQISLITVRRPYCSPWSVDDDVPTFSPLLSQPLVEACLRIPTWLQMRDRGERAVARAAFAATLPREAIERRSKGGAEDLAWRTFRANAPFIRELLLDGRLVRERLVCRRALEAALEGTPESPVRSTVPLFDLVGAEAWLQPWDARRIRSASSPTGESFSCAGHPES